MTVDEKNKLKSIKEITKEQTNKIVILFLYIIKKSEKTSKFGDAKVNKKEFHASKEPIALYLLDINQIITSDKRKGSNKGSKNFIGYEDNDIIRPFQEPIQRFWKEMALYVGHHG